MRRLLRALRRREQCGRAATVAQAAETVPRPLAPPERAPAHCQRRPRKSTFSSTGASSGPAPLRTLAASQSYINKEHVIGRAKGYLPYIGMVTIIMNDYPIVKYILVGLMGLFVLTTKE